MSAVGGSACLSLSVSGNGIVYHTDSLTSICLLVTQLVVNLNYPWSYLSVDLYAFFYAPGSQSHADRP